MSPAAAVYHPLGGRADLPVPVSYFVVGAGVALVVSFLALALLWSEPRWQTVRPGRAIRVPWARPLAGVVRAIGLLALALVLADGLINGTDSARHIAPPLVWIAFWLAVPFLVAGAGNLWRPLSPWRSLGRLVNRDRPERPELVRRIGIWPATIAFVAFTWLELVSTDSADLQTLTTAAIAYTLYLVTLTRWLGVETGLLTGGAFENYNGLLSAISPLRWSGGGSAGDADGPTLRYRGWLRALPQIPVRPGMTAFVIAMIGTVTFDGMSGAEWWGRLFGRTEFEQWFRTVALLAIVLGVGACYVTASWAATRLAQGAGSALAVARSFAHTLVPIAFAYAFAHYFTSVLIEGQALLHTASDPFGLGWNLFGTADWRLVFFLSPEVVWYIQVAVIVLGHVAAVTLAHDRALAVFGPARAVRTQYAMLALMVVLTSLGLFVLAG